MAPIRILIADDHAQFRRGVRALLESHPEWQVCGEAADGKEAVEKAKQLKPDVLLLDVSMPRMNGLDAARLARQQDPNTQILIVSQNDPALMQKAALEAGAQGFVQKSRVSQDLIKAIDILLKTRLPETGPALTRARPKRRVQTKNPSVPVNPVKVRGTELLAADLRETYRQKLARITLDSMVQFVGLLDASGTVLEINHVALDAVGVSLSEVEGKPFWTTFWWQVSEEINAALRDAIRRASQGEFVRWDTEIYGRASGKETIIIDASLMPVRDEQGNVVFITAEGRDITEKKAQEREIARQREELAKLDQLKTKFFANISHEFRTPLTLMMGPLEDAMRQPEGLSASNREHLELAHRNSVRLLKLVNTLLDFSRIEAGRIQASYQPTDLAALLVELASMFRSTIERAGMRLVIDCPVLSEMVYIDREMWEKVVLNLLSNAFKFTFEGEIAVSLRQVGAMVEMKVRDTGTGIPGNEIPQLFERFHRVQGARGRSFEGSGIGLALVHELVKLHGGNVRVESDVGRGSTFTVSVPLGKHHLPADRIEVGRTMDSTRSGAEADVDEALRWLPEARDHSEDAPVAALRSSHAPQLVAENPERSRILLADDNADMREYVQRLLGQQYEVVAVADGESALKSVRERPPDLVISDIMMPRLDGFELLQTLRNDQDLKSIPVILLSARAGEESRVEGLDAGADDYLVKPFSARELLARVGSHLAMARVRGEAAELKRKLQLDAEVLAAIVASSDDAIISKDLDGTIKSWNKSAERLFGYTAGEAIGQHIRLIIPRDRWSEETEILRKLKRGERVDHFETVRLRKDGTAVELSLTISPVKDPSGRVVGASKVARDISERKLKQEEIRQGQLRLAAEAQALRQSEEQLRKLSETLDSEVRARTRELEDRNRDVLRQSEQVRELSWRLLRTQDEERRHIARELHDSAGQTLVVLGLGLAQLVQKAARSAPELATEAEMIQETVQQLHQEIRTTSYLLHPPLLDESGLFSALSWYVQGLTERSGLEITLDISERFGRLPGDMELAVFRLVQECLTNIHRHADSKTAFIRVTREAETVQVEVQDKGKGMSAERMVEIQTRGSGVGIRGMRERVQQLHGTMNIESSGPGTRISASIPLPQNDSGWARPPEGVSCSTDSPQS